MNELRLTVNGEQRTAEPGTTVAGLLQAMGIDPTRVAVERNRDVVPRATWGQAGLADGDKLEIVAFIGGGSDSESSPGSGDDPLVLGGRKFRSRLLIGTGKYRTLDEGREAILRSGAEIVTVALRRVDLTPASPTSWTPSTASATRSCPARRAPTPVTRPSGPPTSRVRPGWAT